MKKALFSTILALAVCATVLAQDNGTKQNKPKGNTQQNDNKDKNNTNSNKSKTQKQHQKMPAGATHGK